MKRPGQRVLFQFPQIDLQRGKLRPALLIAPLPSRYNDWLVCMVSSQLQHYMEDLDELLPETASDFSRSGLKAPSVIRVTRLAVVDGSIFLGRLGSIDAERLVRIRHRLATWLLEPTN